mgnify:FL=1
MSKLIKQIIKFGIVGGSAFVIDYGLMIFLTEVMNINYLISNGLSFSASVVFNYIMSVKWVFDVKEKNSKTNEFLIFVLLSLVGLGINQFIMWIAVEKLEVYYLLSKIYATIIVMVYNFITRKMFLE